MNNNSHRRKNILTGDWVLVSPHRMNRPWQGKVEKIEQKTRPSHDAKCYLCAGNTRANGAVNPNYQSTYVFDNDFAALQDVSTEKPADDLLVAKAESGICRVMCYSPDHSTSMADLSIKEIEEVIRIWQVQYRELGEKENINHVQIFENKGAMMGCSNPHPHGQIWAQQSIPNEVLKKDENQRLYFEKHQRSLLADYVARELQEKERIVYENDEFVALVPFWAVWPYETMILPKKQQKSIVEVENKTAFSEVLQTITSIYDKLFDTSFPYSMGIHQSPTDGQENEHWHWHLSFYPPLLRSATVKKFMVGYEMFGMPQRDITAERAAEQLKSLLK